MNAKYADVVSEPEAIDYGGSAAGMTSAYPKKPGLDLIGAEAGFEKDMRQRKPRKHEMIERAALSHVDRDGDRCGTRPSDRLAGEAGHDLCHDRGRRQHQSDGAWRRHLTAKLGKPFVVENRPSAAAAPKAARGGRAALDGYSLLFTPTRDPLRRWQKMGFDPTGAPVTTVGTGSQVIAIKRSLPVNNPAEFWLRESETRASFNSPPRAPTTSHRRCCCSLAGAAVW